MRTIDVINHFGSRAKAARFLGLTRAAVSQWPEFVPEKSARKLEKLTGGALVVDEQQYLPKNATT